MGLAKNFLEAKHFNTKVRDLGGVGSRKIRLSLKEAKRMVENMLDTNHPSPNPRSESDKRLLQESSVLLKQSMDRLKDVKETKRKK